MRIAPIEVSITAPGLQRIPVVDQAMELAKQMERINTSADIARLLKCAAVTWETATTFVVKISDTENHVPTTILP